MKISFGLSLDGYQSLLPTPTLDILTCGPLGFLNVLETRLGLKGKAISPALRVFQFRRILDEATAERPMFFSESLKKDPFAVAEVLLNWRDELIEAGWDGSASADDSVRIQDLAAVEKGTPERLSPGVSDRLRFVLDELSVRSPRLESLTVRDEPACLPKRWRLICTKLDARYEPVAFNSGGSPTRPDSDLQRFQAVLREGSPTPRLKLCGDRSILCVTAFSEITLAHGTAQWLRHLRQEPKATVTLIADETARVLDLALSTLDEPTIGLEPGSTARPIPQLLLLALRLYWKPVDPRALLEFLAHPACPVGGVLRFKLARAIADCPGIGGPVWRAAIASCRESVESSGTFADEEKQQALERMEQDLKNWVLVGEFENNAGADGAKLADCCARVGRWAALRSVGDGVSNVEAQQFRALSSLCSEMSELLRSEVSITRTQVERLLNQVNGRGWSGAPDTAELGHVHRVSRAASVMESADSVLWWDFIAPSPPPRLPWTARETEQLRAHGVELPTAEAVAVMEAAGWLRPILAARERLVLVYPRKRAGEPVAHHPLLARLSAVLGRESRPLPLIDLDENISSGTAEEPWQFVQMAHRPLPARRRWWRLNDAGHLAPRDLESYSSAAKFIYNPGAWVFQYKAGLRAGPVASLRLQNRFQQEGTLLHRVLELLLAEGNPLNWQTCTEEELDIWLEGAWPRVLEQEGANLLLPGRRADALALLEMAKQAMGELLSQLRRAGIMEARVNVSPEPASFVGGRIGGEIDLVVRNGQDRFAVVDLKLGGRETREREFRENRTLQLAIYGHLLRGVEPNPQMDWPASAFFFLRKERLVATTTAFFPGARIIDPVFPPGELHQCWADFEQIWRWRRKQFDDGWMELTTVALDEGEGVDEAPGSIPPLPHWMLKETDVRFDKFDALVGWRPDA